MRSLIRRNLIGSVAMGLAIVAASACNGAIDPQGGNGAAGTTPTVTETVNPACTGPMSVPTGARFAPTSGPAHAKFELVAAGAEVVIASTGTGVHRSRDGGETWSFVPAKALRGKRIQAMAALGTDLFVTTDLAVHRSTDGGDTWTDVSTEDCTTPTYLSVQGAHLYALSGGRPFAWNAAKASWDALPAADNFFDVMESDGTYLYANSLYDPGVYRFRLDEPDATWKKVTGLPEWGYRAFAFLPGHAFASNVDSVFHSTDDGVTWKAVAGDFDASDLLVVGDTVFAATMKGLQVSNDKGATWAPAWDTFFYDTRFALATDGQHVFAAADDGIRRKAGASAEWSKLHVLADSIINLFPTEQSIFSFSTSGVDRTTDLGVSWEDPALIAPSGYYWGAAFVRRHGKVFGLGDPKSIVVSNDDGATFQPIALPPHVIGAGNVTPTLIASTDSALVIGYFESAGSGCASAQDLTMTLYRSTDDGATWWAGENNLPDTFTDCYDVSTPPALTALVQHRSALLATSWHDGAFRSVDDGFSWQSMGDYRRFTSVGDVLLASADDGGMVRSTDDGATWSPSGLAGLEVRAITVADGLVFASAGQKDGVDGAIHVSSDAGVTWTRVDGTFDARVESLAWQAGTLFAGTTDQSVWALKLTCSN